MFVFKFEPSFRDGRVRLGDHGAESSSSAEKIHMMSFSLVADFAVWSTLRYGVSMNPRRLTLA